MTGRGPGELIVHRLLSNNLHTGLSCHRKAAQKMDRDQALGLLDKSMVSESLDVLVSGP